MAGTTPSTSTTAPDLDSEVEPLADETARQAQRVVAAFANDAEECRMFLAMLNIDLQPQRD